MDKMNVMVLYGGNSSEHEISKRSAETVISNLSVEQYHIIPVYLTKEGKWWLYDGYTDHIGNIRWEQFGVQVALSPDRTQKALLRIVGNKVKSIPIDVVFPVLHGKNGEDGTVQGLLELSGIPYVGCGVLSSSLCMDKHFTKLIAGELGIRQAEYLSFLKKDFETLEEVTKKVRYQLGYPCFVKPANAGSSVGVTRATNKKTLEEAFEIAFEHDERVIVEKAIAGRELECAVLGSGGDDTEASAVGEILSGADFYDYEAKYQSKTSKTELPADIPDEISDKIRQTAIKIFKAFQCSGLARVDFFLEEESNQVIFSEINTMPGFTSISMYPLLWNDAGISTPELIDRLIGIAMERNH